MNVIYCFLNIYGKLFRNIFWMVEKVFDYSFFMCFVFYVVFCCFDEVYSYFVSFMLIIEGVLERYEIVVFLFV